MSKQTSRRIEVAKSQTSARKGTSLKEKENREESDMTEFGHKPVSVFKTYVSTVRANMKNLLKLTRDFYSRKEKSMTIKAADGDLVITKPAIEMLTKQLGEQLTNLVKFYSNKNARQKGAGALPGDKPIKPSENMSSWLEAEDFGPDVMADKEMRSLYERYTEAAPTERKAVAAEMLARWGKINKEDNKLGVSDPGADIIKSTASNLYYLAGYVHKINFLLKQKEGERSLANYKPSGANFVMSDVFLDNFNNKKKVDNRAYDVKNPDASGKFKIIEQKGDKKRTSIESLQDYLDVTEADRTRRFEERKAEARKTDNKREVVSREYAIHLDAKEPYMTLLLGNQLISLNSYPAESKTATEAMKKDKERIAFANRVAKAISDSFKPAAKKTYKPKSKATKKMVEAINDAVATPESEQGRRGSKRSGVPASPVSESGSPKSRSKRTLPEEEKESPASRTSSTASTPASRRSDRSASASPAKKRPTPTEEEEAEDAEENAEENAEEDEL